MNLREASQKPAPVEINLPADFRLMRLMLGLPVVVTLTAVSMLLLSVIQEPIGWSSLAWWALVPWVVAVVGAKKGGRGAIASYVLGLVYYLANLYWLAPVTLLGYGALCFYLAWYFVVTGYVLRRVYLHHRWPFTLILPIVWVAQEYLRATMLTGFPWLFLAHSQHESERLIQISDAVGAYGVTFLVAMVNGLICDLLLRPLKKTAHARRRPFLGAWTLIFLTGCCVGTAVLYGRYRLDQGRTTMSLGKTITVVQEVIPQYVKQSGESDDEIFARHVALSKEALAASVKPDLIVWPETMVCSPVNEEFLNVPVEILTEFGQRRQAKSQQYDSSLRELAGQGAALLAGTPSVEFEATGSERCYNSAVLYLANGSRYRQRYDKMHLVPFGEVVPFKESWPWLYRLLNNLTPYEYEYSLNAGQNATVFEFTGSSHGKSRFAVAICYEDVMPQVPRRLAVDKGEKRIDLLLNISNDGWFVRGGKGKAIVASTELLQHLVICKFRAIENRIGIVRAVNTGISAFITPQGRVQDEALAGSLPAEPRRRQAVAGFLTDRVYQDARVSVYSRMGDDFAIACAVLAGLLLVDGVRCQWRASRKGKEGQDRSKKVLSPKRG